METGKEAAKVIEAGQVYLGIEFGSTRIKAVLTDKDGKVLATGGHGWENRLENGIWTYSEEDIFSGLRDCYQSLAKDVKAQYGIPLRKIAAMGVSAMMHGYLPFDKDGRLLVPFRTWRNTMTEEAAEKLTGAFSYNIPQRWSIAHLYQAVLNGEEHVKEIAYFTTLAGYVHQKLTGEKVLGVGDASGMFPIDTATGDYDEKMLAAFEKLIADKHYSWCLRDILPKVLPAGEKAGVLTKEGAALLDPSGELEAGCPFCPPEGDAGTGMVATNSVAVRTGNISAGTSVFAMVVLEKPLAKVYPEIDLVTTPDGALVGMVHCNNCTSEINAWANLFAQFGELFGMKITPDELFTKLYSVALSGDPDCGGMLSYNYFSGEPVTGFESGAPLFVRSAESKFTLANTMRMHLYSALAALKVGMDLLLKEEHVTVDKLYGHGGFFKTKEAGQRIAAAAMNAPVSVMETAGEGGAWGIALLAAYLTEKENGSLGEFLNKRIFAGKEGSERKPDEKDVEGFEQFMKRYRRGFEAERAAIRAMTE